METMLSNKFIVALVCLVIFAEVATAEEPDTNPTEFDEGDSPANLNQHIELGDSYYLYVTKTDDLNDILDQLESAFKDYNIDEVRKWYLWQMKTIGYIIKLPLIKGEEHRYGPIVQRYGIHNINPSMNPVSMGGEEKTPSPYLNRFDDDNTSARKSQQQKGMTQTDSPVSPTRAELLVQREDDNAYTRPWDLPNLEEETGLEAMRTDSELEKEVDWEPIQFTSAPKQMVRPTRVGLPMYPTYASMPTRALVQSGYAAPTPGYTPPAQYNSVWPSMIAYPSPSMVPSPSPEPSGYSRLVQSEIKNPQFQDDTKPNEIIQREERKLQMADDPESDTSVNDHKVHPTNCIHATKLPGYDESTTSETQTERNRQVQFEEDELSKLPETYKNKVAPKVTPPPAVSNESNNSLMDYKFDDNDGDVVEDDDDDDDNTSKELNGPTSVVRTRGSLPILPDWFENNSAYNAPRYSVVDVYMMFPDIAQHLGYINKRDCNPETVTVQAPSKVTPQLWVNTLRTVENQIQNVERDAAAEHRFVTVTMATHRKIVPKDDLHNYGTEDGTGTNGRDNTESYSNM